MTHSRSKYLVLTTDYLLPAATFLLAVFLFYFAFFSSFFVIRSVSCVIDYELCSNPFVLSAVESQLGTNIFLLSPTRMLTLLTSGDYQIRSGQIKRTLPGTLTVELQSVYPVLALQVVGQPQYATLDKDLRVIKLTEVDPHVPLVLLSHPLSLQLGSPIPDPVLMHSLQAVREIVPAVPELSTLSLSNSNITLTLKDQLQVVFTTNRSLPAQISALKAVLGDATIREGLRKLDVRFAQPVLVKD